MEAHGLPEEMFEIVALSTQGDRIQDRALAAIGGKGLFTAELEEQLADGRLDLAVIRRRTCRHSCHKASTYPLSATRGCSRRLRRKDGSDTHGSSIRRRGGLGLAPPPGANPPPAPDLHVTIFSCQVDTRLRKLAEGEADATLLAMAGLNRLGRLTSRPSP